MPGETSEHPEQMTAGPQAPQDSGVSPSGPSQELAEGPQRGSPGMPPTAGSVALPIAAECQRPHGAPRSSCERQALLCGLQRKYSIVCSGSGESQGQNAES